LIKQHLQFSLIKLSFAGMTLLRVDFYMLRLNPGDNQGISYILANCLLEEGLDSALGNLLKQYEDDGAAAWLYSRALWVFRSERSNARANKYLKEAWSVL